MRHPRRDFLKMLGLGTVASNSLVFASPKTSADTVFDLIVVGAGAAGMACALAASEKGTKVLVIEKAPLIGGTLPYSEGKLSAGGTALQKAKNITDSPQTHFEELQVLSRDFPDLSLVKLACDEAPKTMAWLDSLGFEYNPASPLPHTSEVPYKVPRTYVGKEGGLTLQKTLEKPWNLQVSVGTISVLLKHKLTDILKKGSKVVGVKAYSSDGEKEFFAKNVVLTTGGYASNPMLMAAKHPGKKVFSAANQNAMGDGLELAEKIGAKSWNIAQTQVVLGGIQDEIIKERADYQVGWLDIANPQVRPVREVYVNSFGVRFMDESNPSPEYRRQQIVKQPGEKIWILFDQNVLFQVPNTTIVQRWDYNRLFQEAFRGKTVWYANTIEELAKKSGLPVETLKTTWSEYNQMAIEGADLDFNRPRETMQPMPQGPYFAIVTQATTIFSTDGLAVNDKLQVLDKNNRPIANFYAAGEVLGAAAVTGGVYCSGMLLTAALSFGRKLGLTLGKG
ncbi:MAG: FAD-dependent oxidoreductase [Spirosomataceae bacterium]